MTSRSKTLNSSRHNGNKSARESKRPPQHCDSSASGFGSAAEWVLRELNANSVEKTPGLHEMIRLALAEEVPDPAGFESVTDQVRKSASREEIGVAASRPRNGRRQSYITCRDTRSGAGSSRGSKAGR